MNKRKFLYFLTNKEGKSYFVDDGIVKTTATPTPIEHTPSGWDEQVLKYTRNNVYTGIIPSYTIPLRFVKDAAYILRDRLYNFGSEDVVYVIILRLNPTTGKHEGYFKGEIDFIKYNDTKDYFEANVTETGFYKNLKAYENTTFEIPLNGDGVEDIQMDGLVLKKRINYVIVDLETNSGRHTLGCSYVNEEGTSFGYITGDSPLQDISGWDIADNNDRYILKNISEEAILFNIKGVLTFELKNHAQDINIYFSTNTGYIIDICPMQHRVPGTHTFIFDEDIVLPAKEGLYILCHKDPVIIFLNKIVSYSQTTISITTNTKFKTTNIKAINAQELGNRLIKKLTGDDNYNLISSTLHNCGIYLTSGDALRGFNDAVIKTTWKDFFTSLNRNVCIGMHLNDKEVIINSRESYYQNNLMYDLGEVSEVTLSYREELFGSSIKVGYNNNDYDDVNGRDEFNNQHIYKTPITRVTKEIDLTAKYRADPYGIEFTRINLEGKTTTDSKSDNNVFMLDVIYNGVEYVLNRPAYSNIEGVLNADTIFNTRLSPKNILINNGSYLRSIFYGLEAKSIEFQTTEKNANLSVTLNSNTIKESSDVIIGTLPAAYFIPIEVKLKTVVPHNLSQIMNSGYGVFQFTYLGNNYKGFVLDCSQKPSSNEDQQWTLLLHADNDLKKLIHG